CGCRSSSWAAALGSLPQQVTRTTAMMMTTRSDNRRSPTLIERKPGRRNVPPRWQARRRDRWPRQPGGTNRPCRASGSRPKPRHHPRRAINPVARIGKTLRSLGDLACEGLIAAEASDALAAVAARYAVAITPEMVRLIDRDDAADPIARQ